MTKRSDVLTLYRGILAITYFWWRKVCMSLNFNKVPNERRGLKPSACLTVCDSESYIAFDLSHRTLIISPNMGWRNDMYSKAANLSDKIIIKIALLVSPLASRSLIWNRLNITLALTWWRLLDRNTILLASADS